MGRVAIEQILRAHGQPRPYFWSTHGGAELDLLILHEGRRLGFEVKFNETPKATASMRKAKEALEVGACVGGIPRGASDSNK